MANIVAIKLRTNGKMIKSAVAKDLKENFNRGDIVLVKMGDEIESGEIIFMTESKEVKTDANCWILKKATRENLKKIEAVLKEEKRAHEICEKKIIKHNLNMRLLATALSLNGRNLTFYFTAEGRIDFRNLLRDLVATFRKLIRLQQIGPKDAAKLMGGFGLCGRPVCCKMFLSEMKSITMDLAREQNLEGVTSNKISGLCGKLMCCLDYEIDSYQEMKKDLPETGSKIKTKDGYGRVVSLNVYGKKALIELENGTKVEKDYS
jgi:cell fate regulator YaaT (PSP1 superfamily)